MEQAAITPTECRDIYLCQMTFLIPIPRIRREHARKTSIPLNFATPFVRELNAEFHYALINGGSPSLCAQPQIFWYTSKYNGHDTVQRQVNITPYLLKFCIGKRKENSYAIVLVAIINAHFASDNNKIEETDWCTPHDLVYLERAMTEIKDNVLFTHPNQQGTSMYVWLNSILKDVSNVGMNRIKASDIFSLSNISIQRLDTCNLSPHEVIESFKFRYYNDNYYSSIDDYQNSGLYDNPHIGNGATATYFIHGLLYKNDNFLQLHPLNAAEIRKNCYTNNRIEKYWADFGSIVTIKVGNPFLNIAARKQISQYYDNNLTGINCLMELCLLSKLSGLLSEFKKNSINMKSHEIEQMKAKIAEYFSDRMFHVPELDKRLSFFIERFGLNRSRDWMNEIAQPRRIMLDLLFTRSNAVVVAILSIITITITFLTLL